jgi:hypothetical protein
LGQERNILRNGNQKLCEFGEKHQLKGQETK